MTNIAFTLAEVFSPHPTCQRNHAFTLAEVLVTLGIIGVVSAMTVPSLMQNYQRQSYVTQLHKVYNEFSQASLKYQTDNNAVNLREAGLNSQAAAVKFIKDYFKIIQDCGHNNSPCFPSGNYKKLDGTKYVNFDAATVSGRNLFVLASGASISMTSVTDASNPIVIHIGVDINGQKGPNIVGRDFFGMELYNNGVIDDYSVDEDGKSINAVAPLDEDTREENFQSACNSSKPGWGHGCFGRILNDNWQMTY